MKEVFFMNDTFMKEKPVGPLLASMALPMFFSMLVNSLYNIVDSFFVAQISEQAMTALSLVYPVQNLINALPLVLVLVSMPGCPIILAQEIKKWLTQLRPMVLFWL